MNNAIRTMNRLRTRYAAWLVLRAVDAASIMNTGASTRSARGNTTPPNAASWTVWSGRRATTALIIGSSIPISSQLRASGHQATRIPESRVGCCEGRVNWITRRWRGWDHRMKLVVGVDLLLMVLIIM